VPSLGYQAPDRKPFKLNVPIDEDLKTRLEAAASSMGTTKSALARKLINEGMDKRGL
jgi:hypothetical protein